jgi:hypothetical protein
MTYSWHEGDRVEVTGIEGVHTVLGAPVEALSPPHTFLQVVLCPGTVHGRWRGGDTLGVEAWRCHRPPVDPQNWQRQP